MYRISEIWLCSVHIDTYLDPASPCHLHAGTADGARPRNDSDGLCSASRRYTNGCPTHVAKWEVDHRNRDEKLLNGWRNRRECHRQKGNGTCGAVGQRIRNGRSADSGWPALPPPLPPRSDSVEKTSPNDAKILSGQQSTATMTKALETKMMKTTTKNTTTAQTKKTTTTTTTKSPLLSSRHECDYTTAVIAVYHVIYLKFSNTSFITLIFIFQLDVSIQFKK